MLCAIFYESIDEFRTFKLEIRKILRKILDQLICAFRTVFNEQDWLDQSF